ncbi:MAG: Rha family transcriptional regulator [Phascolarctobacterium sp.]|nr:Rha family transcriptional regulator [Phascolarctobacterium sp.]
MKDLVFISNNQVVVSSRIVAERFNKEHKSVLRSINEIVRAQNCAVPFYEKREYKSSNSYRTYPEYYMNRDGFMLLVMGFTTKPAMQVKLAFINAFNEMEAKLKQQSQIDVKALAAEIKRELMPQMLPSKEWEERQRIIANIEWYLKFMGPHGLLVTEAFVRGYTEK